VIALEERSQHFKCAIASRLKCRERSSRRLHDVSRDARSSSSGDHFASRARAREIARRRPIT
jgi:hypothetical protein